MPSEFNHIDDFFRKKEEEASADNSMQDKHWQQMKAMMAGPTPVAKIRTLNPKMLWQLLVGFSFIAVIGLLVWRNVGNDEKKIQADNPSQQVVVTTQSISKSPAINPKNTIADKKDSQKTNLPFVRTGDIKINFPIRDQRLYLNQTSNETGGEPNPISILQSSDKTDSPEMLLAAFFDQLKKPEQEFLINTNRDTTILCNEGTSIFIPANSFEDGNGNKVPEVTFKVQEFYEIADMIGNKLNTTSEGNQLVSGGMLNLKASAGGQPVSLKTNVFVNVKMPTKTFDPQMQLFYGNCGGTLSTAKVDLASGKVDTADTCLPTGNNWSPAGQQQGVYFNMNRAVKVLDVLNDPRKIIYRKSAIIAKFLISDNCTLSNDLILAQLKKRYGRKYSDIKVRRGWKTKYTLEIDGSDSDTILNEFRGDKRRFDFNGMVGDSIYMSLSDATALKLISKEDSLKWEETFKKEFEEATKTSYADYSETRKNYNFNVSNLGWINCDKFLAYTKDKLTDFVVDAGADYNQTYLQSYVVFDKFKSVMSGNWSNGRIYFSGIPLNEKVNIICVGIKNGKAIYSVKETTITSSILSDLQFEETTPTEFKEKLKMFGNVKKG